MISAHPSRPEHRATVLLFGITILLGCISCFGPGEHIDLNVPDAAPDASADSGIGAFIAFRLDTTAAGIPIEEAQTDFPLLLRLNENLVDFNTSPAEGEGISVTDSTGTLLAHQIELWDAEAASALVWIRIPRVEPNDETQQIRLYLTPTTPQDPPTDVFPSSFESVLHLSEPGNNLLGGYTDASESGYPGTGVNRIPSDRVDSVIGRGARFANESYIALRDFDAAPEATTLSLWFTADTSDGELVSLKDSVILRLDAANQAVIGKFYDGLDWREVSAALPSTDAPMHVLYTVNPVAHTQVLYLDAVRAASSGYKGDIDYSVGYTDATIGVHPEEDRHFFTGVMDEVRIEAESRSDDWVKLCYENQRPDRVTPWPVPE